MINNLSIDSDSVCSIDLKGRISVGIWSLFYIPFLSLNELCDFRTELRKWKHWHRQHHLLICFIVMKMFDDEVSHYVFSFPLLRASVSLLFISSVKLKDTKDKVTCYFTHHFSPQVCLSWKELGKHSVKQLRAVLQLPPLLLCLSPLHQHVGYLWHG